MLILMNEKNNIIVDDKKQILQRKHYKTHLQNTPPLKPLTEHIQVLLVLGKCSSRHFS